MFITSYTPHTPSRRRSAVMSFWYLQYTISRRLSVGFQRSVGRAYSGRRVAFSKGSTGNRRVFRVLNDGFTGLLVTSLVYEYQRDPNRTGAIALVYNALGCWFYLPQVSNMSRFGYLRLWSPTTPSAFVSWAWPTKLCFYPLYSKVSYLRQLANKPIQFLRAAGAAGLVLATNFYGKWAVILMPSGVVKLFWNQSYAHRGCVGHAAQGRLVVRKAGSAVNAGKSPRVRGTVKNANDHPNGGRCRSLRLSRTPWGYTAKRSRTPRLKTKLKPLDKRAPKRRLDLA